MLDASIEVAQRTLRFKSPAGTSRGVYTTRKSWYVTITDNADPTHKGVGECAPLPDLSCDAERYYPRYGEILEEMARAMLSLGRVPYDRLGRFPSMCFGLETALMHYQRRTTALFDTPFARGEEGIPINGLVWMGTFDEMARRLDEKLGQGFRCVKLKIGAIDFDRELELVRRIREAFPKEKVELRVDANCAFTPDNALSRMDALARYDIHSCEQPIKVRQYESLARICRQSPVAIALDEELIGLSDMAAKQEMLDAVMPRYIVIKPSLHGGMAGTEEWIRLARERGIGSWITSSLESNVGLNALAHFTAHVYGPGIEMPQGLGTGQLFVENVDMPLQIINDKLYYGRNV